jgi:hypothetical protein
MPIPDFTEYGLLPAGEYPATRNEISDRYLNNPNRAEIWLLFEAFLKELQQQNWYQNISTVWLDGGFTSDKPSTKDIDVIIDVSSLDEASAFAAVIWLMAEQTRLQSDYRVDAYPYHPQISNNFRSFFAYVKTDECLQRNAPKNTRKGLLIFTL